MLAEKTIKPDDIITMKLTSGEEVIAKLVEEQPMHLRVVQPVVLIMQQNGIGMAPYLFTVDESTPVKMSKMNVTVIEKTGPRSTEQYLDAINPAKIAEAKPLPKDEE
jgi:hypothetical protein